MTSLALAITEDLPTDSAHLGQYAASQYECSPESTTEDSPRNDVNDQQAPTHQPRQKRRRVTRACDECRRKKIKCDGKQPCTHCTVYGFDCTFVQPSHRTRNITLQYVEALESQLNRAKALLQAVLPTVDLDDSSIDTYLQSGQLPRLPAVAPRQEGTLPESHVTQHHDRPPVDDMPGSHLEAMVKATGQLDLDQEGKWDYQGQSSGQSFMRGLRQFDDMFQSPPDPSPSLGYRSMSQDLPALSSSLAGSSAALPPGVVLPDKEQARVLCDNAIIEYSAMLRVVHLPTFYKQLYRVYAISPENYGSAENSFLALLYAVLAVGTLFSARGDGFDIAHYEALTNEGVKYFRASRHLLDITECRDLISLQTIVFMIQFLQLSAKLSTCYAYIGVALRSALRMGLHRSLNEDFSPIEAETRKRLFWVIRRMDAYIGAMLGLPRFLEDDDIDQEWPLEVDDEYITEMGVLPMPAGRVSVMAAFNAHARLVPVLHKICKYVYPIKGTQVSGKNPVSYTVDYCKIRELEQDLEKWLDELPMALRPGGKSTPVITRAQQILRMAFGHAQLLLYRPFLHYVSQSYNDKTVDPGAFACASACVNVSRNIIHISTEMRRRGLLAGAYWFSIYTTFFATVSILYFVLQNPTSPTIFKLLRDAVKGKEVLAFFAKRSMAADRCSTALQGMFEKLPESIRHGGETNEPQRRRPGSSQQPLATRPGFLEHDDAMQPRRASSFPESIPYVQRNATSYSLPISQNHSANLGFDPTSGSSPTWNPAFFNTVSDLTPASSNDSLSSLGVGPVHNPQQNLTFVSTPAASSSTDPSSLNPISDISSMMFPTADPLAYPNQPMTAFENTHSQAFHCNAGAPVVDEIPQQMPGAGCEPHLDMFAPNSTLSAQAYRGFLPQTGSLHMQMPGAYMQFEDLLVQEGWAPSLDHGLGMANPRPPLGEN